MSEMKSESIHDMYWGSACGVDTNRKVYLKSEADKVLDAKNKALELAKVLVKKDIEIIQNKDKEIEELKAKLDKAIAERDGNQVCIDALKQKLEDAQATAYVESVDAGMENRRLKRELWLARAERAVAKQAYYDVLSRGISSERSEMYYLWNNVERKCRAKAEKYK